MAALPVLWAAVMLFAGLSAAIPAISFPINSQVPPVARVGQPFSFVFSPSTFSSNSPITYSLSNAPKWLFIDSDARRLFGTPGADAVAQGSVTGVPLNLVATDDSGSTTLAGTLVVSRNQGPRLQIPLERQIPEFGTFSSPSTFLSAPGEPFSFQLDPNTFTKPPGSPIHYYATMADNTPLPAWVSFEPGSLSFSGQTPPSESLVQPPQRFSLRVLASDVVGFGGASLAFDIIVGNHRLIADQSVIALSAIPGTSVSYSELRSHFKVDGEPATARTAGIVSVANIPSWLSVNKGTWHITGTVPKTAKSTNFTLAVQDMHSDTLNITIAVEVASDGVGLFTGSLPSFTITPGKPFSFDLKPYLSEPRDTDVQVETGGASHSWIQFDPKTATLFGHAPDALKDSGINVKVTATSRVSKKSATVSWGILIRSASDAKGSAPTSDPAARGPRPTESADGQSSWTGDGSGQGHSTTVLLAVLLPLLAVLAIVVFFLFWYFRRRKDRHQESALSTRDISSPLPGSLVSGPADVGGSRILPDFSRRFGKSFSADDIFGTEKYAWLESQTACPERPGEPLQHVEAAQSILASGGSRSDPGTAREGVEAPVVARDAPGASRPGARGKISSSLSSITETSIGELVDSRGLDSVGNDGRPSFRDKIEVNVPRLSRAMGADAGPQDATSPSTQDESSMPSPSTDTVPLRAESRLSDHAPAPASRKPSWPWVRAAKAKRRGSKTVPAMKRLSEQPSVLTVDTVASGKSDQQTAAGNDNVSAVLDPSSLPLPKFPSRVYGSRPPTRSGPFESPHIADLGQEPLRMSATAESATAAGTGALRRDGSGTPALADREQTRASSLDLYKYNGPAERKPFALSRTWSTVPTTDEWVDETVESLDLSLSGSQQQNWTIIQESPAFRARDASTPSGRLPDSGNGTATSAGLLQVPGEGQAEREVLASTPPPPPPPGTQPSVPSRPGTAVAGAGIDETPQQAGLRQQSQSVGVSLRSEGSRSDYAVFI